MVDEHRGEFNNNALILVSFSGEEK